MGIVWRAQRGGVNADQRGAGETALSRNIRNQDADDTKRTASHERLAYGFEREVLAQRTFARHYPHRATRIRIILCP